MKALTATLAALSLVGLAAYRGSAQIGGGPPPVERQVGRYQLATLPDGRIVVLDTATGQCWSKPAGGNTWRDEGSPAPRGALAPGGGPPPGVPAAAPGAEQVNGVEVKVGDPQFTLTWDSRADLDLHVLEPGGSHLFWENRKGEKGGLLDVDDVDGRGPENIFWLNGPTGEYRWYVNYYGGLGGSAVPTHWKVRVKNRGQETTYEGDLGQIGAKSKTYALPVEPVKDERAAR